MKLNLSIISISLVAMATARHTEVIMRPLDAPEHICGSGGCSTMTHLEAPHTYSMCGEDLLGITSMDLSEDPISPGTTAKVTLKGLPIIDIGSGAVAFKKSALNQIHLTQRGFGVHAEIFVRAKGLNMAIKEIPAKVVNYEKGSFSVWRHGWGIVCETFQLWGNLKR